MRAVNARGVRTVLGPGACSLPDPPTYELERALGWGFDVFITSRRTSTTLPTCLRGRR
jgi:hypothetical protein